MNPRVGAASRPRRGTSPVWLRITWRRSRRYVLPGETGRVAALRQRRSAGTSLTGKTSDCRLAGPRRIFRTIFEEEAV